MRSSITAAKQPWLLHELVFGGFLAVTWARLAWTAGWLAFPTLEYVGLIAGAFLVAARCRQRPDTTRWRIRLGYYFVAMNIAFASMKTVLPIIHPALDDAFLQHWDLSLFGGNLSLAAEPFMTPVVTETLAVFYGLFLVYLFWSVIRYLRRPLAEAKAFYIGLFSMYGVGLLCFTVLPAVGPYFAMADQFSGPLHGSIATSILVQLYPVGTAGAVFPSLHCAVSGFILALDWRYDRSRFWWWLAPVVVLWISTAALRFHYAVDVLSGALLMVVCVSLAFCAHPKREESHAIRPIPVRSSR